jgi:hypothetical protein
VNLFSWPWNEAFDPMIERAELLQVGALQLHVVTTDDLIAMRRDAQRPTHALAAARRSEIKRTSRCSRATSPMRTKAGSAAL